MTKNMTALTSAFARAYHYKNNDIRVFSDSLAHEILTEEEYKNIASNMAKGIGFFNPKGKGNEEQALRWIVDNYLSLSPIGRSAFAEQHLATEIRLGVSQYLIFASGYDTYAYRQENLSEKVRIFEIDRPEMIADKRQRVAEKLDGISNLCFVELDFEKDALSKDLIQSKEFDRNKKSFCSLLGISYYLTKETFEKMIAEISSVVPAGSSMVFDYPDEHYYGELAGERAKKQIMMASAAGEVMKSSYSYKELEQLLAKYNFYIYEHLTPEAITDHLFSEYNNHNPDNKISAFDNVNYLFAVKKDK